VKKAALLLITLGMLSSLIAVVVAKVPDRTGLPADCQSTLGKFIAHEYPPGTTSVVAIERARKPEHLTKDSHYPVFGSTIYYQTDSAPSDSTPASTMPLPYPPKEVWCILLKEEDKPIGAPSYAIVLAALHMDMYNADWMIHEGPRDLSTPGLVGSLKEIGCGLALDQAGPRLTKPGESHN